MSPINHAALARLTENGQFDTTFGKSGKVLTEFQLGEHSRVAGLAVDSSDRVVIAGTVTRGGRGQLALARFNSDGSLDANFNGGRLLLDFPNVDGVSASAVILDTHGRIVVAGTAVHGTVRQFALARLNPDASLDESFGEQGLVLVSFDGMINGSETSVGESTSVGIDETGKIVLGGAVQSGSVTTPGDVWGFFALARFNENGTLDHTFSGSGKVLTSFASTASEARSHALAVDGSGRIVLAGGDLIGRQGALAAYLTDGSLDLSFGLGGFPGTGRVSFPFFLDEPPTASAFAQVYALALDSQNRPVIGGWAKFGNIVQSSTFSVLARFQTDGKLDPTFGQDGQVLTDFPPHLLGTESINALRIDMRGRILTGGFSRGGREWYQIALGRYSEDGRPDPSFNGVGQVFANFDDTNRFLGEVTALGLDSQGRIVIAGHAYLP